MVNTLSLDLIFLLPLGTWEGAGSSRRTSFSTECHGEEGGGSQPQGNKAGSSQAGRDHRSLGQAEGTHFQSPSWVNFKCLGEGDLSLATIHTYFFCSPSYRWKLLTGRHSWTMPISSRCSWLIQETWLVHWLLLPRLLCSLDAGPAYILNHKQIHALVNCMYA